MDPKEYVAKRLNDTGFPADQVEILGPCTERPWVSWYGVIPGDETWAEKLLDPSKLPEAAAAFAKGAMLVIMKARHRIPEQSLMFVSAEYTDLTRREALVMEELREKVDDVVEQLAADLSREVRELCRASSAIEKESA
jgi:hypothetical protein